MKKIFTFLAAAAASLTMWAGDFQLYFGDKPAVNGETYTTYYTLSSEEEFKGNVYKTWIQDSELYFYGTPGTNITIEVTTDNSVQVCSLDGNCNIIPMGGKNSITKSGPLRHSGESAEIHQITDTRNDEDPTANMKDITVTVSAYETSNPAGKVTVTVHMLAQQANGIAAPAAEEYVRAAAGNTLAYSVSSPATLSIYAITGNLVAKYPIANAGTINLSSLPSGIYIYTDGKHKGKIVLR